MHQQLSQEIQKIFNDKEVIIIPTNQQSNYSSKWARIIERPNSITVSIHIIDHTERESVFNLLHSCMEKWGYEYARGESENAKNLSFVSKWVFYYKAKEDIKL